MTITVPQGVVSALSGVGSHMPQKLVTTAPGGQKLSVTTRAAFKAGDKLLVNLPSSTPASLGRYSATATAVLPPPPHQHCCCRPWRLLLLRCRSGDCGDRRRCCRRCCCLRRASHTPLLAVC